MYIKYNGKEKMRLSQTPTLKTKKKKKFFHKLIDLTETLICFYTGTGSQL